MKFTKSISKTVPSRPRDLASRQLLCRKEFRSKSTALQFFEQIDWLTAIPVAILN